MSCKQSAQFGKLLRSHRTKKGLSQEELAHKADVSVFHIGRIERGQSNITLKTLCQLAKALNMTVSKLTKGLEKRPPSKQD